ncbi:MAG: STN domain-containing protein [Parabacteroides sp.]
MKITIILCLLTTFCTFASVGYSQTTEISLHLQGVTLQEALDEVKKQTEFSFWYRNEEVNLSKKVSVKIDRENIQEVMAQLLSGQDLTYAINEKHIIIYKKNSSVEQQKQVQKRISGIVTDRNGEPVIGG